MLCSQSRLRVPSILTERRELKIRLSLCFGAFTVLEPGAVGPEVRPGLILVQDPGQILFWQRRSPYKR